MLEPSAREVMESPSFKVFKNQVNTALSHGLSTLNLSTGLDYLTSGGHLKPNLSYIFLQYESLIRVCIYKAPWLHLKKEN